MVTETVPTNFFEKEFHTLFTMTIARKIFHLSSKLSGLDYHQFHNSPPKCECNTSSNLHELCDHIITGDLSIIPTSKLKGLTAKGPKYRESWKVDWNKNLLPISEPVD